MTINGNILGPIAELELPIRVKEDFDAAVAIETIEHARDIRTLLDYTAKRLRPGARLFVQSLLHQSRAYLMDDSNWMGRNFFRDRLSFTYNFEWKSS